MTDVYLCGPNRFMADMKAALAEHGVEADRVRMEIFNGGESSTPGVIGAARKSPHRADGRPRNRPARLVRAQRHRRALESVRATRAYWNWPRRATFPVRWACRTGVCHSCESGLVSGSSRITRLSRSTLRRQAICSSAVPVRSATSLSICNDEGSSGGGARRQVAGCVSGIVAEEFHSSSAPVALVLGHSPLTRQVG